MTPTSRDLALLEALTCRIPMLTLALAARLLCGAPRSRGAVRRRLQRLARTGWLAMHTVNAHPLLPVVRPLATWKPGSDDPDPERLSRLTRQRWSRPARPTEICVASRQAASLFGSTAGGPLSPPHVDHDLRLACVYVHYQLHRPEWARLWIGEHALPKAGYRIKDPDAFLRDEQGRVLRVIESAGRYSPRQVESFHEHCVENNLAYELW